MSNEVSIERAVPEYASCLTSIAHDSKASWGYPTEWLEAWRDALSITPEYVRLHAVRVAMVDGHIVGFAAVRFSGSVALLDHLWVLPAFMGRGFGTRLFQEALLVTAAAGANEIVVESDPNATQFYESRGAQIISYAESEVCGTKRRLPVLRKATSRVA